MVKKNFITIFIFQIFIFVILFVGYILCGVGLLAALPLAKLFEYYLVKDVILTSDASQNNNQTNYVGDYTHLKP